VEDAAEESDDEYAGLGGASDDGEDEEDAYDRQMINDNSAETVDEKQLAALNACVPVLTYSKMFTN
jgi:mediator of replication checkpoint protein 1